MNGGVFQHKLSISNETANEKFRVTDLICGERARRHVHDRAELCTRLRAATLQVMLVWRRAPGRGQTRPLMMSPTLHVMGLASLRRTRPALTGTVTYTAVVRSSRVVLNDERVQLHIKLIVSNSKSLQSATHHPSMIKL